MTIYGYARCSTNETRQDINRQKRELKQLGASDATIYFEYESGSEINRPELIRLLNIVNIGDSIVTTEISRITRSTKQLCDTITILQYLTNEYLTKCIYYIKILILLRLFIPK